MPGSCALPRKSTSNKILMARLANAQSTKTPMPEADRARQRRAPAVMKDPTSLNDAESCMVGLDWPAATAKRFTDTLLDE
eukprot:3538560-Pyramimonas_sp.AAC.1